MKSFANRSQDSMAPPGDPTKRLVGIVARLRGPGGCPWDREQTHESIRLNLLEESYETLEAMDRFLRAGGSRKRNRRRAGSRACTAAAEAFQEELGDLLMQVAFHAQIARETGWFNFDDVARAISDKLVRRHPHVFGKHRLHTSAQVLRQWEAIKKTEKNATSILKGLPRYLPALLKADKVQRKVARVGFDWKHVDDVVAKIEEELAELKSALAAGRRRGVREELGDLLFAAVNLARFAGFHAEDVLNDCVTKFVARFQQVERIVHRRGRRLEDCSLEELDAVWESVKRASSRRRSRAGRRR